MSAKPVSPRRRARLVLIGLALLALGAAGGWLLQAALSATMPATGPTATPAQRTAIERIVRDYILENPEILPEAMERLQRKESLAQLGNIREELEAGFPGALLGNPQGQVTLVEFSDYACGYCRQSAADVEALIARNPDLRVVLREMPILSPQSTEAARWALAAAEQGKFAAFHKAMFAAGMPSETTIAAAARDAGLDLARARAALDDPAIEAELRRNLEHARQLGFQGTPSWVVGDEVLSGAVGLERLARAVADAQK